MSIKLRREIHTLIKSWNHGQSSPSYQPLYTIYTSTHDKPPPLQLERERVAVLVSSRGHLSDNNAATTAVIVVVQSYYNESPTNLLSAPLSLNALENSFLEAKN